MKKSLRVMGVSILTALLAVSLAACKGGSEGDTEPISDKKGPVTEWELLTSEVMKLYRSGDYTQGVIVAKRALQVAQKHYGPDHPNVALSLSNLAEFYEAQMEYAKAEPLYKHSLEILDKSFGKDDPFLVPTLLNMASLYNTIGRKDEADRLMEWANNIQAK